MTRQSRKEERSPLHTIAVHGGGYVGLVVAAALASRGHTIYLVEPQPQRHQALLRGASPVNEPGLEALIADGVSTGHLRPLLTADETVSCAVHFVTVGTPPTANGDTDETQLTEVAAVIGRIAVQDSVIVLKSTAPPGASTRMLAEVRRNLVGRQVQPQIHMVVNPEFLRAGSAVSDFIAPDRVVIGGSDARAVSMIREIYLGFAPADRILVMDEVSASLVKYAANAMLATRISFINEFAALADAVGADIESIRSGLALDSRIGPHHLGAGIGYGGSCLPKDLASLQAIARTEGTSMRIAAAVEQVNHEQPHKVARLLQHHLGGLSGMRISIWGASFKEGTDDMRQTPVASIVADVIAGGASVQLYDPRLATVPGEWAQFGPNISCATSALKSAEGADAIVIATSEHEFREIPLGEIRGLMRGRTILDGRNLLDPQAVRSFGLVYIGFGRP